jgi:Zn-dependent protease with chaperone function
VNYDIIRLVLEKEFSDHLFQQLQGEIIFNLMQKAGRERSQDHLLFQNYHYQILPQMSSKLYNLCQKACRSLNFSEKIDFYICNNPQINALAISRQNESEPHIIGLNSALIEKLDDEELLFVIGHEIGHLVCRNDRIWKLLQLIYNVSQPPLNYTNKIKFWQKLAELSADRFGYIASPNLNKVVSCFFKLAAGISTERVQFDSSTYLDINHSILDNFSANDVFQHLSHPVNPLRLEAIKLFSSSKLFQKASFGIEALDEELTNQISKIMEKFALLCDSEIDRCRLYFLATAGVVMAAADGEISDLEYADIINALANFTLFPEEMLKSLLSADNVPELFDQSTKRLLEISPADSAPMFNYLIQLALSDRFIKQQETDLLFQLGKEYFDLSEADIAQEIMKAISYNFQPGFC